jgi:hypothetical protein
VALERRTHHRPDGGGDELMTAGQGAATSPGGRLLDGLVRRLAALTGRRREPSDRLAPLPAALRGGELVERYLGAERSGEHRQAGAAATVASQAALDAGEWRPAELWAFRALWHFERGGMPLHAVRAARQIAEVRSAAGDPSGARRYYAEAISEARDLGAEREEGLAAIGLGRAEIQLGNATTGRRLGQIALDLLERSEASDAERAAARELRGTEKPVGRAAP